MENGIKSFTKEHLSPGEVFIESFAIVTATLLIMNLWINEIAPSWERIVLPFWENEVVPILSNLP